MRPSALPRPRRRAAQLLTASTLAAAGVLSAALAAPGVAHADATSSGGDFVAVVPGTTVLNTTSGVGAPKAAIAATKSVAVKVQGGSTGVPASNVRAVLVDVTAVSATASTYLSVYRTGDSPTAYSTVNVPAGGSARSNSAIVAPAADGTISVYNSSGNTQVYMDVQGYYTDSTGSTGGGFVPVAPTRILDTRAPIGVTTKAQVAAGGSLTVKVTGGVVPTGASAVFGDVIIPSATKAGNITVSPATGTANTRSTFDFPTGTSSDGISLKPDASGNVKFTNHAAAAIDIVLTAEGYATASPTSGAGLYPVHRRLASVDVAANSTYTLPVAGQPGVPTKGVTAAAFSVAVGSAVTAGGYARVWAAGTAEPTTSFLNWPGKVTVASNLWTAVGATGAITIRNVSSVTAHFYIDLTGYYTDQHLTAPAPYFSPTDLTQVSIPNSTTSGLEYAYVDNTGRLLVGLQPSIDDFSSIQWTTISTLADQFAGAADATVYTNSSNTKTIQFTAKYSDTQVRATGQTPGAAPASPAAFSNFGGSVTGAPVGGSPAATTMPDNSIAVFMIGPDGKLWFRPQTGTAQYWQNLGGTGLVGTPTLSPASNGVRITAANSTGQVVTTTYVNGVLAPWVTLGGAGIVDRPAVATRPGYLAQVVVRQGDGTIATSAQRSDGTFTALTTVDDATNPSGFTAAGAPAAIFDNVTGQIEILARNAADNMIYSSGETVQGSQTWRGWVSTGGYASATDPTMAAVTGSAAGWGWVAVYRTPANATKTITPGYQPALLANGTKAAVLRSTATH